MNDRRTWFWCRRCAAMLFAGMLLACGGEGSEAVAVIAESPDADVVELETSSREHNPRHAFYQAYLADVLAGDTKTAAEYYNEVLGAGAEEPILVAQSALRLAGWAESNRQRRHALDLAVRASVLGADIPRIKTEADDIRRRLAVTVRAQDIEVRGPPAGTTLVGVPESVAEKFAAAELLLATYHTRRLKPRLEALVASIRGKRAAMERAVRAYRDVVDSGSAAAVVAAEFRIASIYYDYSLSLTFELPGELDPEVARSMSSSLRSEVNLVRARARAAYMRSLAAEGASSEASGWSEAAARGLASVDDLLRSGK